MKTQMLITLVLGGAAFLFTCGCRQPVERVVQSQSERNWLGAAPSAISSAEEPIEPKILPKTHFAAALLFEQQGQLEKAIIQYRKAVAVNHQYLEAYNRLGILLGRTGRHGDAESALRRAIELKPAAAALRNNLGYEYALQRRWTDAEAELNNAIRLDPEFARAYVNLGMVLAKQHRFEEALEAFNAVLPEADAYYNLGLVFGSQHHYHDAADAFRHVLALNPDFSAASAQLERIAPKLEVDTSLEPVTDLQPIVARAKATEVPAPAAPPPVTDDPQVPDEAAITPHDNDQPMVMLAEAITQMFLDEAHQMISTEQAMSLCTEEGQTMTMAELIHDDQVDQSIGDGAYVLAETSTDTTGPADDPADHAPAMPLAEVSPVKPSATALAPAPIEEVLAELTGAETEPLSSEAGGESAPTPWWVTGDLIDGSEIEQSVDSGDPVVAESVSSAAEPANRAAEQPSAMTPTQADDDYSPVASVPLRPAKDVLPDLTGTDRELPSSGVDTDSDPMPWWAIGDLIDGPEVDQPVDSGDHLVAESSSNTAEPADITANQPPAMTSAQVSQVQSPVTTAAPAPIEEILAELTGAETEFRSSVADVESAPTSWWVTYDACTFTDDNAWLAVYALSASEPGPLAPAWYAPPPLVMPTTAAQTIDDWTAGGWFAEFDLAPGEYPPRARPKAPRRPPPFYPPAPELTPDEFVDWIVPCPPAGTGF